MDFRLAHTPKPLPFKITHKDAILMMGSCFSENIGEYFLKYKFNCKINPNGILFNPISILRAIRSYISITDPISVVQSNDLFYSMDHHGDFCFRIENELKDAIANTQNEAQAFLKKSNYLIITFGTAFVYRYLKSNTIVANCHKLPQSEFKKELLKPDDIVKEYNELIKELKKINPDLKILLTVSPVKYLRDGIEENNLSKSILIQSVHQLVEQNSNCSYFPAFELVNDDLRDYRFYKEDLAHPNDLGIQYVWEKFSAVAFNNDTIKAIEKINDIVQAASHRAINSDSEGHFQFKKNYLQKCLELEKEFPSLDFSKEKAVFN